MSTETLGGKIRELRIEKGISVRALAKRVEKSAPFLSDIELGRRYPSPDVLGSIAEVLGVDVEVLACLDTRSSLDDVKGLVMEDPAWGVAFRTAAEKGRDGTLSPQELLEKLKKKK